MNLDKRVQRRATMQPKQQRSQDRARRYPLLMWAGVIALLGVIFLMRNVFSVWRTLEEYPQAPFWEVFFSTQGENGESFGFWMLVWLPIIALGVVALLLVAQLLFGGMIRRHAEREIGEEIAALQAAQTAGQQQWQAHLAHEQARQRAEDERLRGGPPAH